MAAHRSNFSDNALTTLESLVLECQLENARQHQEEMNGRRSPTSKSSENNSDANAGNNTTYHEMPRTDHDFIATLKGNDQCVDCRGADVEWASVTFGILLCTECSGVHRALGTHVSRVRSIKMDSWSDAHIQAMRLGGNKRCRDALEKNGQLNLSACSIRERYETLAAQSYHDDLKKRVKAADVEEKEAATISSLTAAAAAKDTKNPINKRLSRLTSKIVKPRRKTPDRSLSVGPRTNKSPSKSLSASAPTITYMGRSFQANNAPTAADIAADEMKLRLAPYDQNDVDDLPQKLEQLWHREDDFQKNVSSNQSYASNSLASSSATSSLSSSWFSGGGGGGGRSTHPSSAELTVQDVHTLHTDPDMKEYVRQQLLQQWNQRQQIVIAAQIGAPDEKK